MSKTYDIVLDGQKYAVRRFSIGQLKSLANLANQGPEAGWKIFDMAMMQCDPKVENPDDLTPTMEEFKVAMAAIMEAHGMQTEGEARPPAIPAAA